MKIYRVRDDYRGKVYWTGEKEEANFIASTWASELEVENEHITDGTDWVDVDEIKSKQALLDLLNIRNEK